MRWTFKLYDASGDGVLEQQEVDRDVDDHDLGNCDDYDVDDHDLVDCDDCDDTDHNQGDCDYYDDLFQVLLIMQSIEGAFSREETGISRFL